MAKEYKNMRLRIESLLSQGRVLDVVKLTETSFIDNAVDAELAQWLVRISYTWQINGFLDEQRRICELIAATFPANYEALHILGFHAQLIGDFDIAEKYYNKALSINHNYAFSRLALAQLRMMQTEFREGREAYETRFEAITEANGPDWRGLPIKRWQGESILGKHLYLWAEQGLGDIILFSGFLPALLAQKPRRIALGMFPKLIPLFTRSFPSIAVEPIDDAANHALAPTMQKAFPQIEKLAQHTTVPFSLDPLRASFEYIRRNGAFDVAAPLGDMLVYCMPSYIPAQHTSSYLLPDSNEVTAIHRKLRIHGEGKYIGISWKTQNTREITRNIPLESWLPILKTPGCHFVSLQHGVDEGVIRNFCKMNDCTIIVYPGIHLLQDADGLTALTAAMDEVITIDNSNAHLAGALGIKTTVLLPKGHNFRWPLLPNRKTLWYKNTAAFRQETLFDWQPVIEQVASELRQKI